jgi:hypothetical protein
MSAIDRRKILRLHPIKIKLLIALELCRGSGRCNRACVERRAARHQCSTVQEGIVKPSGKEP